jgi:hypothetical protein
MKSSPSRPAPIAGTLCGAPGAWPAQTLAAPARALGWGLAITLAQVLVACLLSGQSNLGDAYLRLFCWDGVWYRKIVEQGYWTPPDLHHGYLGSVGFFPGYPLFARCLKLLFHVQSAPALLLASQLACWGFWTYLVLFFQRWRVPAGLAALGVGMVLVHPASFFLVASYSESFFLMNLLGFLYWAQSSRPAARPAAALHGLLMTATRIVGVPLVIAPVIDACLCRSDAPSGLAAGKKRLTAPLLVGAGASLGCVLFFGYCQWQFGQWDLYQKTQAAGWGLHADYVGLFKPAILGIHWPQWGEGFIDPEFVSRLSVPATLVCLGALAAVEWRLAQLIPGSGWRARAAFVVCAWLLLYVSASAQSTRAMSSMIRYTLCVQAMLALAVVHLLSRVGPASSRTRRCAWAVAALWGTASASFELALTYRFTHGQWVA